MPESISSKVKDSKKLSERQREILVELINEHALGVGVGLVSESQIDELNITKFYRGAGCKKCNYTGYKGRSAVFEVLKITDN